MRFVDKDKQKEIQNLFTNKILVGEGEVSSMRISPSKMFCPVFESFRLTGVPMSGEEESFESTGYKSSGNSRHQAIQEFLKNHKEVEWVNPYDYVKENNLPFEIRGSFEVSNLIKKHPDISEIEAREILKDYEINLTHTLQPLSFQLDGLIRYKGELYLVEIKTIGKKDFNDIPLEKHQWQGKTYSFLLRIPKILWIYECRDDFKIKTEIQEFEEVEWKEVRNRLNNIIIYKDKPTKLIRNKDKCKFCRYLSHCEKVFSGFSDDEPF